MTFLRDLKEKLNIWENPIFIQVIFKKEKICQIPPPRENLQKNISNFFSSQLTNFSHLLPRFSLNPSTNFDQPPHFNKLWSTSPFQQTLITPPISTNFDQPPPPFQYTLINLPISIYSDQPSHFNILWSTLLIQLWLTSPFYHIFTCSSRTF